FASMLKVDGLTPFLVSVKAAAPGYPFYGRLETDPPSAAALSDPMSCLVDPEIAARRQVRVGSVVALGGARLRVAGVLLREPDRSLFSFNMAPRVLVPAAALDKTGLLRFGSRIRHAELLALPPGPDPEREARALKDELERTLGDPYLTVTAYGEAQPSVRETLRRVSSYFLLVALVGLTLGCVGMAASVSLFLRRQADSAAVLRCMGLTGREVARVYGALCLAAGVQGGVLGLLAGGLLSAWGLSLARELLRFDFPVSLAPQPASLARALGAACVLALGVNAAKLRAAARVPPAAALRESAADLPPSRAATILTLLLGLGALFLYAWSQGESPEVARGFALSLAAASGALALLLVLLLRALGAARPLLAAPEAFALRHAVLGLSRRPGRTLTFLFTLSLGVSLLGALQTAHHCLSREILSGRAQNVPDLFLIDVQKSQRPAVETLVRGVASAEPEFAPLIRARLSEVNGAAVAGADMSTLNMEERSRQRLRTREYNLTYKDALNASEKVVAGAFWKPGAEAAQASVEEGFARRAGIKLGDRLTFDVQGRPVEGTVTSLREVSWMSMKPNFFVVMPPAALGAAPQTLIASFRVREPRKTALLEEALAKAAPNVSVIDVGQVLANVSRVTDTLLKALTVLAWFCVGAGLLVLAGTAAMGRAERLEETAILRALGLDSRAIARTELASMGVVSLCAFAASALVSTALGWELARWLEVDYSFDPKALAITALASLLPILLAAGQRRARAQLRT
ncbi:MAG TPA: FtsX-like permease family protein, partial [Elusimicrobiota bacterium]|nr:FtsX-like permease family protein [Elusimicrobiota bacterium]